MVWAKKKTWAFQDGADHHPAGACPIGHWDAWWAVAAKAAKYWAAAPDGAQARGKAGSPWQPPAPGPALAEAGALAPPARGRGFPESRRL